MDTAAAGERRALVTHPDQLRRRRGETNHASARAAERLVKPWRGVTPFRQSRRIGGHAPQHGASIGSCLA